MRHPRHVKRRDEASYEAKILLLCTGLLILLVIFPPITQAACQTQGVESAGLNSHQRKYDLLRNGYFLVEVHFESCENCNGFDSPVIREVIACDTAKYQFEPLMKWERKPYWVDVGAAGINSHQRSPLWLPDGYFITQIDLDGWRKGGAPSDIDGPVIGGVRIARIAGYKWDDCHWLNFGGEAYNKTYGIWSWNVPEGYYITQLDLDSYIPPKVPGVPSLSERQVGLDSPIIGAVRRCRLTKG